MTGTLPVAAVGPDAARPGDNEGADAGHDPRRGRAALLCPDWLWTGRRLLAGGALALARDGTIDAVLEAHQLAAAPWRDHPRRRLAGHLLMAGLCDAHSHAFQRAFRGLVQYHGPRQLGGGSPDSFWTWRDQMYRVAGSLDPEGVESWAVRAFAEQRRAGVTAIGEFHYLHHDPHGQPYDDPDELALRIHAAARKVGLRLCLLRVAYGQGGLDGDGRAQPLQPVQRRFADPDVDSVLTATWRLRARLASDPLTTVGLAPHSVRAVPAPWWAALASWPGVIHAHVAEQPAEVAACRAAYGVEPLQLLADAGLVHERFAAVHLTHPSPGDVALLAAADAAVVACPTTEMDLGDGFLPLAARTGLRLAIGADSYAAVDPLAEARAVEWHGRAQAGRRLVLPGDDSGSQAPALLSIASGQGYRTLGLGRGGVLEPGALADLCAVDLDRPEAYGMPPLEAVAWLARPEWVTRTWVAGDERSREELDLGLVAG